MICVLYRDGTFLIFIRLIISVQESKQFTDILFEIVEIKLVI